ncbi:MAG TPA: hypothetical protein VE993_21980 [Stellaceae bacterium]|nr:hypothetical protein [Stellaceae bacterium]
MTQIRTRIRVGRDRRISGIAPAAVPPGDHEVTITIAPSQRPEQRSRIADLPLHDVPWDGSISLRREDMYGDDGR